MTDPQTFGLLLLAILCIAGVLIANAVDNYCRAEWPSHLRVACFIVAGLLVLRLLFLVWGV